MPDPTPANASPQWQRNVPNIKVTNQDGSTVPVRYSASTRTERQYDEYWRTEAETPIQKQLESTPNLIKGDRKKPSIMQYPIEIGSGEVPHVMQFKAYWRWESKDFQKRVAETKAETEKIIADLKELLTMDIKGSESRGGSWSSLDPDFLMMTSMTSGGGNKDQVDALIETLNDGGVVNVVDPTLNTNLTELVRTNPMKARDIVQETLRAHQSKLQSIQQEEKAGLGRTTLTQDEIDTLETYGLRSVLAEEEHAKLVKQVEDLKKDPTATIEQKKAAQDTLQEFKEINASSLKSSEQEVIEQKDSNFSGMGAAGKDIPNPLTTAAQAGQNQSIYDQMISIYLPFCNKINNEDTMVYEAAEMKAVGSFLDFLGTPVETSKQLVKAAGAVLAGVAGQEDAFTKFTGVRINPRMEKLFKNKDFRTFNFSWEMYPKNRMEVEQIHNIVEAFRYHGNPSFDQDKTKEITDENGNVVDTVASVVLRVPAEFQIRFLSTNSESDVEGFVENPYIPKIGRCVLNSVSVDYTPNSIYSSLKNNAPTAITLTLQFTEIGVITREAIEAGY